MAKIRSRINSGSEKKILPTLLLFLPFADCCSASKTSDFEPDALIPPALSGFGLKAAWFSTILLNFDFNEVRFLVKCGSFVKISSILTGAFLTIVNGAKALRGALGVPLPGLHQTRFFKAVLITPRARLLPEGVVKCFG